MPYRETPIAPVIAIDGPSASGKGVVASRVAAALGFHYLESGALYRLVALAGGDTPAETAKNLDAVFLDSKIILSGQDVTDKIREEITGCKEVDLLVEFIETSKRGVVK